MSRLLLSRSIVAFIFLSSDTFALPCFFSWRGSTCRARLEERLLSAHSPAYREWMTWTGLLWPRWRAEVPGRLVTDEG